MSSCKATNANGKQVSRLATKSRTAGDMRELGYRMTGKFAKHKFVFRFKRATEHKSNT